MKHKKKKPAFRPVDRPRVRKSYYTFTREYPRSFVPVEKSKPRAGKKQIKRAVLFCCLFALICAVSFFFVRLGLDISYSPIPQTEEPTVQAGESGGASALAEEGLRGLYMPVSRMNDERYIRSLIKQIKRKDANSVVIDFKTVQGRLAYSSMEELALLSKSAMFDNDTVRKAINLFSNADITVAARIYCFEDSLLPQTDSSLAVKYMNTEVNWLDGSDEKGGKAWLNPYSKKVRSYLIGIIGELRNLGINCFILESLQFPGGENTDGATYPGEKDSSGRNALLLSFINQIKKTLPENATLLFSMSANAAANGAEDIFFGSMEKSSVPGIVIDTAERPLSVAVDRKTDFVSILSLYSSVSVNYPGKTLIPIIDYSEYSYLYRRAMKKAGYTSFILMEENGEY
ncbi:MAG: putative glycoside hydrolase [Oscillospiraceae bacterium]|nr:putative glycoside hydrolase [Oscillospiraceae bacterium]